MYKLIVIDMDDTLLRDDLTVSQDNIDAILAAKAKGCDVLFCSGRSNQSMINVINAINTHDDHEFFASFNGAKIETIDRQIVFYKDIQAPVLHELIDIGESFGITTQLYGETMTVAKETKESLHYVNMAKAPATILPNLKEMTGSAKVLYNSEDFDKLKEIENFILDKYGDLFNVFYSKPRYLEVLNREANKGLAVKFFAETKLHIKAEEVIAVGDSFNDSYMIKYAGLGCAMANAHEDIKAMAQYVTKNDNNHDGVKEIIDKFILNV